MMKNLSGDHNQHLHEFLLAEEMLNAIPFPCYMLGNDGAFISINSRMETTFFLKKIELLGKNVREVFQQSIPDSYYAALDKALYSKEISNCDYYSSASKEWFFFTASPFNNGVLVCFNQTDEFKEKQHLEQQILQDSVITKDIANAAPVRKRRVYRRNKDGAPNHMISISQDISQQVRLQEEILLQLELQKKEMEAKIQQRVFQFILNTQEQERKRIAESIHNGLSQLLYGVKLSLSRMLLTDHIKANSACLEVVSETGKLLAEAIRESRKISHELTPTMLEGFGLQAAINEISSKFSENTVFKCEFSGLENRLESYQEIAVYRIVQELMLNTVKYAKATFGEVILKKTGNEICVIITDNGIRFNNAALKKYEIGLINIKNKVSLLQGSIQISLDKHKNNIIKVSLPLL